MIDFLTVIYSGLYALYDYLTLHVLTCLVPAFFIAGGMSALLPKETITKYLGKNVPKYKAYPLSAVAGFLLAVCSCTILPLFAGIKKKGAGIGPAIAFLYTGPAINILAIVLTGSVIGWDFAISRIILSFIFAIVIGIIISNVFKEDEIEDKSNLPLKESEKNIIEGKPKRKTADKFIHYRLLIFFVTLFAIMVIGASGIGIEIKTIGLIISILLLLVELKISFKREEIKSWLKDTFMFFKMIFPLLLVGVFVAGVLTALIPKDSLTKYVGSNTIPSNLVAVLFGVFMYFPTLVEVPMAKMFLGLGMAKGPLLAYLLADPVISFSSILVVRKIMGTKRTLAYILLIIIFCTLSGLIYGFFVR